MYLPRNPHAYRYLLTFYIDDLYDLDKSVAPVFSLINDELVSVCSKVFGSRLKSQWAVDHSRSVETIDDSEQSSWFSGLSNTMYNSEGSQKSKIFPLPQQQQRSNFLGTKFRVFDANPPNAATKCHSSMLGCMRRVSPKVPASNYPVSSISYKVNVLRNRGPRQMRCEINTIPSNSFSLSPILNLRDNSQLRSSTGQKDAKLVLKNKAPRWKPRWECWCLDFKGRVNFGSVKNFQLVACLDNEAGVEEHENIILQLGKADKNYYIVDYQYPISAFQAFAIGLSSFDTKVVGEKAKKNDET
ncbi:hypothetical protein L1887_12601 [Cichorium endivia]|nr:hypothetical protein L1887_12601 [Cichorium endivia]